MSSTISRRNFLRGMAAGAASVVSMGVLSSCAQGARESGGSAGAGESQTQSVPTAGAAVLAEQPAAAQAAVYNAGTYTSVQATSYATVEVRCTFSESALTDVSYQVLRTSDSDYFKPLSSAMDQYCARIVENGRTQGVDGISGGTLCAAAIRDGVNACTVQALGISLTDGAGVLNPQDENFDSFEGSCEEIFSPVALGSMTLPNRVVKSAGSGPWNDTTGSNMTVACELYSTMAENGVSLNILAGGVVRNSGLLPDSLGEDGDLDESLAKIEPLISRIHGAGGKVGLQICYGGLAPTIPDSLINETAAEDLDRFIERVGISAERARRVGLDCIEIKGASADGLNGFLSRRVNRREDEYGPQSIENRTRLFCRMIQKIKEVNGSDFPVGALINGVEENDVSLGDNERYITIEESREIARQLVSAGADWLQVRVGVPGQEMNIWALDVQHIAPGFPGLTGYGTQFDFTTHYQGLVDGSHSGFAAFLPIVKAIKEAVDVPVGCAAYMDLRVGPDYLNEAVKRGELDLIFMNRPLNADPELVSKMEEGRREDVRPCMHCMHCHDNNSPGKVPSSCRVNAASYNAFTDTMPEGFEPAPAEVKRSIMVIGAGPGGVEAACVAARRGHSVTLYDSADKVGGLLHFARGVKGSHERFDDYISYMAHELEKNHVDVRLMTTVDMDLVKAQNPDGVVVAVGGARESRISGSQVFSPEEAFGSPKLGQRVVILGAGVQAVDFAAYLIAQGKKVTMVHSDGSDRVDAGQSGWFRAYMLPHLYAKGVKIWHNAAVKGVTEDGVEIETDTGAHTTIPCDSVVEFYDMVPNTSLAEEIQAAGFEVCLVGDCAEPYNIQRAVRSGNLAARAL